MEEFEGIRRVIAIYGQLLDSKRFEDWGELFTVDAEFRVWGKRYQGRAEIVREIGGMQPDQPGKHVVLQPVIDLVGSGQARTWTDLCALASSGEAISIATIGRYHDDLIRDTKDRRWRIQRRVLVMAGESVPEDVARTPSA